MRRKIDWWDCNLKLRDFIDTEGDTEFDEIEGKLKKKVDDV